MANDFNRMFVLCAYYVVCITISLNGISLAQRLSLEDHLAELHNPYAVPDTQLFERISGQYGLHAIPKPKPIQIDIDYELSRLNSSHKWISTWPSDERKFKHVNAVSFDNDGNVVIFHRADRAWDSSTFDIRNRYVPRQNGPIIENTIVAFNRITGATVYEFGSGIFYLPHGLTIDSESNFWVTDVALHQVMKFSANNRTHPSMVLGNAFVSGNTNKTFCKPTAVAVLDDGDFFVADGYCNSRIIKYSKDGKVILQWGKNSFQGQAYAVAPPNFFAVPHALTLVKSLDLLCVADRENGRVQCFHTNDGTFVSQYHSPIIGDRIYSVAYAPIGDGQLFVVNGPTTRPSQSLGFVIDMKSSNVLSKFSPNEKPFTDTHDIVVSADGKEVYVVQLTPPNIFKFVANDVVTDGTENQTTQKISGLLQPKPHISTLKDYANGSRRMLYIVAIVVSIVCLAIFASYMLARYRRSIKNDSNHHNDVEYNKLLSQC